MKVLETYKPMVSIIIPCFNAAKFILEAVDSIQRQSYSNIEIVIFNDGSTDGTAELLRSRKSEIVLIDSPHCGISRARNLAIQASRGDYLAFMDADDILHPERIQKQHKEFEVKPDLGLCYSLYRNFNKNSSEITFQDAVNQCLADVGCLCGTVMIPRSSWDITGPFDESLQRGEFLEWYLKAISKGLSVFCINEVLYFRRIHAENSSRNRAYFSDYARVLRDNLFNAK